MLISAPDDYGMSPDNTLAHRADDDLPPEFESHWSTFREECRALPARWHGRLDHRSLVWMTSARAVTVAGDLRVPGGGSTAPRAIVILLHGASPDEHFEHQSDPWHAHCVATLRIRVRGYPPSTRELGDRRSNWIRNGLEVPDAWIVRGAIADVMQAVRGCRAIFGDDVPLILCGESLGGGLAVMAASQCARLITDAEQDVVTPRIDQLIVGLPSLGDWRWRAGRYSGGIGADVNLFLEQMRDDADRFLEQIRLCDAALHARWVTCPVLAKLAHRDDTVPAPSAAAVINALGSTALRRHAVMYGHYDGGIADLRLHARFERLKYETILGFVR